MTDYLKRGWLSVDRMLETSRYARNLSKIQAKVAVFVEVSFKGAFRDLMKHLPSYS